MTRRSNAISGYGKSLLQPYLRQQKQLWVPRDPLFAMYKIMFPNEVELRKRMFRRKKDSFLSQDQTTSVADSLRWHTVKRQLEALLNIKHYLSKQTKPEKVNLEMGNQQSSHLLSLGLRTSREATWRKYR
ncbi:hypothetical protein HRG_013685 [Hirsutella rhossiliensis]